MSYPSYCMIKKVLLLETLTGVFFLMRERVYYVHVKYENEEAYHESGEWDLVITYVFIRHLLSY